MEDQDVLAAFGRALEGFSPGAGRSLAYSRGAIEVARAELDHTRFPSPVVLEVVLRLGGFQNLGRADKLAWEYSFRFEGVTCSVANQKWGLRLYWERLEADPPDSSRFAERLTQRLVAAQRLLEDHVLQPLAQQQIGLGNVTIRNQYHSLNGAYLYFRDLAETRLASGAKAQPPLLEPTDDPQDSIRAAFEYMAGERQREAEGWWNTHAMVTAYFSQLEHVLVGLLPWASFHAERESISEFIASRWALKFSRIFDPGQDPAAMRHLNQLQHVAETWRNTYGHGGFDKSGNTLYFHLPNVGAVPATLSKISRSPHFKFLPADEDDLKTITARFDEFDHWVAEGVLHRGYKWVIYGLDYRFDEEFRKEVELAGEDFDEFLADYANHVDRATNMDW
jgi:hypothetical protein